MAGTYVTKGSVALAILLAASVLLNSCKEDPTLAILNTSPVTEVSINSAKLSGSVTSDGGAEVTARGFCWGMATDPEINDNTLAAGTGPGEFSATLSGLEPHTIYHVRAFAENSVGIAYGNDVEFETSMAPPSVTTGQITNLAAVTASCGGNVNYDGGAPITARGVCWSTSPQPDLSDPHTTDGTVIGVFTSQMTNLVPATVYYVRAYASNETWTVYGEEISFRTKLADIEGNLYNTVLIGTKLWMAENLRVTKLTDNTPVSNITDNTLWVGTSNPAYCWYDNNISFKPTYGALYNWYTVSTGELCPAGWHVPTDVEFNSLEITLGMASDQSDVWGWRGTDHGYRMKNQTGWDDNGNGSNSSGFSALPGGYRFGVDGIFVLQTTITYWWTSSEHDSDRGWYRRLDSSSDQVYRASTSKKGGKYVRCVKD